MGMGIIMGALGGAGQGAQVVGQDLNASAMADQQFQQQKDLTQMSSDLALQREQALMQMKDAMAEQQRQRMTNNIATAKQGVVNQKMADTYGDYDAAAAGTPNSGTPLTPEQQAVINGEKGTVDAEKAADLTKLASDPETYIAAAINSGYIDPAKVADIAHQNKVLEQSSDQFDAQQEHDKEMERMREGFQAGQTKSNQAFQASESQKQRDMEQKHIDAMYGNAANVSDSEKANWVHTYVTNNGAVPRSAPAYVRQNVGMWAAQMGIGPDDIAAGTAKQKYDLAAASTAGHRGGTMAGVEAALPQLADNAVELSQKVGNGKFVPLNKLAMMADSSISDPTLAAFKAANQALASEYQQVISRGGTNVTALKEAMEVLNRANSPEAYAAAVQQVKREVQINVAAMNSVRNNMGSGHGGTTATVPNPVAPSSGGVLTYDPATGTFH